MQVSYLKNLIKFFGIALCLVLVSCSGKKGKTNSSFKLTLGGITSSSFTGGLMLYGKMVVGGSSRFGKKVDATGTVQLELKNGTWEFFAIAWDGSGDMALTPATGVLRCGITTGVFSGGDAIVNLNLSNANCADSIFHKDLTKIDTTSFAPNIAFPQTSFMTCDRDWVGAPAAYNSPNCDGNGFGAVDSYQVILPEYIDDGAGINILNLGLQSDCQATNPTNALATVSANGATNNFNARIPLGRPGAPFVTMVKGFLGSIDCGITKPARGFLDRIFPSGMGEAGLGLHDTGTTQFRLFDQISDAEVCGVTGGAAVAGDIFSAGDGVGHPYAICSREQLEAFAFNYNATLPDDTVPLRSSHFKMYRDIDFGGSSFPGIGDGATGYIGKFRGRKYRVSNIKNWTLANSNRHGFFRYLGPSSLVDDLTLSNFIFECDDSDFNGDCNEMGLLAGRVDGGTVSATSIINVRAQGYLNGGQSIGGLIGSVINGTSGTNISDVHFMGDVEGQPNGSAFANVGGLVGEMTGNVTLTRASTECTVYGQGTQVGGLVGIASGGTNTISLSTARCRVSGDRIVGGLVGNLAGTGDSLLDSYSFGNLQAHCTGGCDVGSLKASLGGVVGESSGSITRTFSAYTTLMMNSSGSGDALAFMGGLVGTKVAGTCNASFFSKVNNSGNPFGIIPTIGGGCGTFLNSAALYQWANYSSAAWGITSNPALAGANNWVLPTTAEGFDVPRLGWEYANEANVPYLVRPCENNFTLQGSGSLADPYQICTMSQFLGMTPGLDYVLKKDIEYLGAPLTSATHFISNIYKLDGRDHEISGLAIELSGVSSAMGLFNTLQAGSYIKNVSFTGLTYKMLASASVGALTSAGALAAYNSGLIDGVDLDKSEIRFQLNNASNVDGAIAYLGGIVGTNNVGGTLQYIDGGAHVSLQDSTIYDTTSANDGEAIYAGGAAGRNDGDILYSHFPSGIGHNASATGFNAHLNHHKYGGVVGYNTGNLEQVASEGRIEIRNWDDTAAGGHFAGLAVYNNGTIDNCSSMATFTQMNGGSTSEFSGLVAYNDSGAVISNSYYSPSPYNNNEFAPPYFVGTGTVSVGSGTNTVTGTSTLFTSELAIGDYVNIAGETHQVASIISNTSLTLSTNHVAGAVSVNYSSTNAFLRPTAIAGLAYSNLGTVSDSYCFAGFNVGNPNEGMTNCLDLSSTPNMVYSLSAGGFTLDYDDSSSLPQSISTSNWDVDDDFLYGISIWTIESSDQPPRLRAADFHKDDILYPGQTF